MSTVSALHPRRRTATRIGYAGALTFGIGLYFLVRAWSPSIAGPLAWPIALAIVLVGVVVVAATVVRDGGARVVGAAYVCAVLGTWAPHFGWMIIPIILLWGMVASIPLAGLGARSQYRSLKEDLRPDLFAHGRLAVATIVGIAYQSTQILGDPVIKVSVSLAPVDGGATVAGERDMFSSELEVPWIGQPLPALFSPTFPNRYAIIVHDDPGAPDAVRELYERLRAAPPTARTIVPDLLPVLARLGELRELRRAEPDAPWERYGKEMSDLHNRWLD
jgi:hypothetical protein